MVLVMALLSPVSATPARGLFKAVARGDARQVEHLLATGADPNARNRGGATPLTVAAKRLELRVVEALLAVGADTNALDEDGRSALMYVVAAYRDPRAHTAASRLLTAGADTNLRTPDGATMLIGLLEQGPSREALRMVRSLTEAGADLNLVNSAGETALSWALHHGWLQAVDLLLDSGADVNLVYGDGESALLQAAGNNADLSVLRRLLRAPVDLNAQNPAGRTPLMLAATGNGGMVPIRVYTLLVAGADPSVRDSDGRRALLYASRNPNLEGTPVYHKLRNDTRRATD